MSEASNPAPPSGPAPSGAGAAAAGIAAGLDAAVAALGGSRRPGQHAMAQATGEALADGVPLLAEAGTGTGKSLAYLVPAVLRSVTNDERVVVSTATLALQRQIITKDLPLVAQALAPVLPRPADAAVLKGWHNYLCRHKIAGGYPEESGALFDLPGGEHPAGAAEEGLGEQVVRLRAWAQETDTGDRDDLVPGVTDRAWRQVSVPAMDCLGGKCPLLAECFPERAKRAAHEADIVVTNHAMLGIAASGSPGVLPEHDAVIIDEAHELVARARNAATAELGVGPLLRTAALVRRHGGALVPELEDAIARLAQALPDVPAGRLAEGLTPELADVVTLLGAGARAALTATKPAPGGAADGGLAMARSALTVTVEIADRLLSDSVATRRDVLWCEEFSDGSKRLRIAPLEVAQLVAENLFAERAAVLTSATLRVGGSFTTTAEAVGLTRPEDFRGLEVEPPFDYAKQAIRYVAADLPPPGRAPSAETLAELTGLVVASEGGTLGLFSSRRAAELAAEHVRAETELPILCQGEDSLPALVQRFREDPRASLFGTLSLWQGVDVPGLTSRLVVIDRIPFPRPDDPVIQALGDVARSRGRGEFMAVSIPHAALLLAQGAGRLVRATTDRGVVAVLDSRLAHARYASLLRASLPPMWPTNDGAVARAALARLAREALGAT